MVVDPVHTAGAVGDNPAGAAAAVKEQDLLTWMADAVGNWDRRLCSEWVVTGSG